jgi:anti-anti-sigma factor
MDMALRTERISDVVIVVPEGMLSGGRETDQVESELRRHVQANEKHILLDLRNTSHLASVAIGMLVGVHTSSSNRGLTFAVCNVERRITNTLTILRLVNVLNVYDKREEALEAFARG